MNKENYSTHETLFENMTFRAFLEDVAKIETDDEFEFVVTSFVNYFLKLDDAAEVLFREKEYFGLLYLIRGLYEILLQFCYLTELFSSNSDKTIKRARGYMYFHYLERLQSCEQKNDSNGVKKIKAALSNYADIEKELKATKKRINSNRIRWFTLFNGYKSFNELEKHFLVNKSHSAYANFSKICHGESVIRSYSFDVSQHVQLLYNIKSHYLRIFAVSLGKIAHINKT